MTPCNPCDNGSCGSCVAERLVVQGHIRDAKIHCGCAGNGHQNTLELDIPKVKSMFSKVKDEDPHIPETEVVEERNSTLTNMIHG